MKKNKIIFWVSTSFIALGVALPAALFSNSEAAVASMKALGFPHYFGVELSIAKALGGLALLLPMAPMRVKEWAYAGFAIDFVSAIIADYVVFGSVTALEPLAALLILAVSYVYFHKVYKAA